MSILIHANKREIFGRDNWKTRAAGAVPAVIYGPAMEPKNVSVDKKEFLNAFRAAGESALVDLIVNSGEPIKVLIQDAQYDPITSEIIHADFRAVDLTKEITAKIKLRFVGEAPAVKELGGTMVHALDEIEARALPAALVSSIEVDISRIRTFDDAIKIGDLVLPPGIVIVNEMNETVAIVTPPRSEEELAALGEAVVEDVSAIEVEKKVEEKEVVEESKEV